MLKWMGLIFIGVGLLITVGTGAWYWHDRQRSADAADWPQAQGTVLSSRVESRSSESSSSGGRSRRSYTYLPAVEYAYSVGGREYRSARVYLGAEQSYGDSSWAEAFVAARPRGGPVAVRYNPDDPADAALIVDGPPWWMLLFPLMGLLFIGIGVAIPRLFAWPEGSRLGRPGGARRRL
ncbi:MAG TPA: DUF3592 domain-containing protein [Allosphingosinicella sp.]|jgi:hypothetical protein|nr:DUF3592 domain-containing protein [Allosphingosinicella sp.]